MTHIYSKLEPIDEHRSYFFFLLVYYLCGNYVFHSSSTLVCLQNFTSLSLEYFTSLSLE